MGLSYHIAPGVVLKGDYQFRDNANADNDVQNRLKKLLGKFDKNAQIEQIDLSPPSIQGETTDMFRTKGFKITPEFREQVIKKGIPTYALPPVIGYGALNSMGENENGDQM